MEDIRDFSDIELRKALKNYGQSPGPITDSTREVYRKKLASLIETRDKRPKLDAKTLPSTDSDISTPQIKKVQSSSPKKKAALESKTEALNTSGTELEKSDPKPSYTWPLMIPAASLLFIIIALYFEKKNVAKQILILLVLSPFWYIIKWIINNYRQRRRSEMQSVCKLVEEVLELLQSPDSPEGVMPILHIRDTILTPAERKDIKMTKLWTRTVKFIEEHESRVKVELVNVDGEDFRAWKWIGSKKL